MDCTRLEFFLDDGWKLIGQVHQWLSALPESMRDRGQIDGLIRGLQSIWSNADDLEISRIARASLAIEQVLERVFAESMEFSSDLAIDLTDGTRCLQELLLGLEATREEPEFPDLGAVIRLERRISSVVWENREEIADACQENFVEVPEGIQQSEAIAGEIKRDESVAESIDLDSHSHCTDKTLLGMLEQFVAKLDDTCQRLHARMLTDETHYVSTTSRLEHLSQVTRELVDQIICQAVPSLTSIKEVQTELNDVLAMASALNAQVQTPVAEPIVQIQPSPYSVELNKLTEEFERLLPSTLLNTGVSPTSNLESDDAESGRRRVLIVEQSIFYRHLIASAVQSAGFEPVIRETFAFVEKVLEDSSGIAAILMSPSDAAIAPGTIALIRSTQRIKLIGMKANQEQVDSIELFDACVVRSRPLELIAALERLLCSSGSPIRMSA